MEKIPVIIDTDLEQDGALALIVALSNDKLDIRGLTMVGENNLEDSTSNAIRILENFKKTIGVYQGAVRPMVKLLDTPLKPHGTKGLKVIGLPAAQGQVAEKNAIQFLEDELKMTNEAITIISLGSLTNIATLLVAAPELKPKIKEICIRGGAALGGNKTPVAEENIWKDPEAARIVFSADVPVIMCGLDVTDQAGLSEQDVARMVRINNKAGKLAAEFLRIYGQTVAETNKAGLILHDVVAVARIVQPTLFRSELYNVIVDLDGTYTRGCTVTDLINVTEDPKNVEVVLDLDRALFVDLIVESLEGLGQEMTAND